MQIKEIQRPNYTRSHWKPSFSLQKQQQQQQHSLMIATLNIFRIADYCYVIKCAPLESQAAFVARGIV